MVTSNVINGLIDNSKNNGNISSTTKNDKSNSSLDVNDFCHPQAPHPDQSYQSVL